VIGAGLSGLTCANELIKKNYQVTIVEAMDRIGGRIISDEGTILYKIYLFLNRIFRF